jgi:hypothetical protein
MEVTLSSDVSFIGISQLPCRANARFFVFFSAKSRRAKNMFSTSIETVGHDSEAPWRPPPSASLPNAKCTEKRVLEQEEVP